MLLPSMPNVPAPTARVIEVSWDPPLPDGIALVLWEPPDRPPSLWLNVRWWRAHTPAERRAALAALVNDAPAGSGGYEWGTCAPQMRATARAWLGELDAAFWDHVAHLAPPDPRNVTA